MAMSQQDMMVLGNATLEAFGLKAQGWRFKLNTNKSRLGVCRYRQRTVEISIYHLKSENAEIRNTLLHEVAHALVGPGHAHGPVWYAKAREIGCNGQRCGKMEAPAKYIGTCPCGSNFKANRLTQRLRYAVHRACGKMLTWQLNAA